MIKNAFKAALATRQTQIGCWLGLANPYSAEIVGGAGFDWLLVDGEHAPNTLASVLAQLQSLAAYPAHPVVRPAWNDPVLIKQYLDIGAQTLLVPMIESQEDAIRAVSATRYPPRGVRGVGSALARASRWNREADYLQAADDEMCVLVQLETPKGIAALDAVLEVEGVDGVFIGPADLSASMGHIGNPSHPDVQRAIRATIEKTIATGKAAGILMADKTLAAQYIELGATFVAVGVDTTLLARGAEALASYYKGKRDVSGGSGSVY